MRLNRLRASVKFCPLVLVWITIGLAVRAEDGARFEEALRAADTAYANGLFDKALKSYRTAALFVKPKSFEQSDLHYSIVKALNHKPFNEDGHLALALVLKILDSSIMQFWNINKRWLSMVIPILKDFLSNARKEKSKQV